MRRALFAVPALVLAGIAVAQNADRASPLDPQAKAPAVEFRSAFEGYRPFAEQEQRDWRKANEEVREARGHAGQKTSKPQPGSRDASGHQGHGARK